MFSSNQRFILRCLLDYPNSKVIVTRYGYGNRPVIFRLSHIPVRPRARIIHGNAVNSLLHRQLLVQTAGLSTKEICLQRSLGTLLRTEVITQVYRLNADELEKTEEYANTIKWKNYYFIMNEIRRLEKSEG